MELRCFRFLFVSRFGFGFHEQSKIAFSPCVRGEVGLSHRGPPIEKNTMTMKKWRQRSWNGDARAREWLSLKVVVCVYFRARANFIFDVFLRYLFQLVGKIPLIKNTVIQIYLLREVALSRARAKRASVRHSHHGRCGLK